MLQGRRTWAANVRSLVALLHVPCPSVRPSACVCARTQEFYFPHCDSKVPITVCGYGTNTRSLTLQCRPCAPPESGLRKERELRCCCRIGEHPSELLLRRKASTLKSFVSAISNAFDDTRKWFDSEQQSLCDVLRRPPSSWHTRSESKHSASHACDPDGTTSTPNTNVRLLCGYGGYACPGAHNRVGPVAFFLRKRLVFPSQPDCNSAGPVCVFSGTDQSVSKKGYNIIYL